MNFVNVDSVHLHARGVVAACEAHCTTLRLLAYPDTDAVNIEVASARYNARAKVGRLFNYLPARDRAIIGDAQRYYDQTLVVVNLTAERNAAYAIACNNASGW